MLDKLLLMGCSFATPRLSPGDSVFLKRGDVFEGSLRVILPGTPARRITIGAYGTGVRRIEDQALSPVVEKPRQS